MRKIYLRFTFFLFIAFSIQNAAAQIKLVRADTIPMITEGDTLQNPWAGGLNSAQFSKLDLNGDEILDLVVFERDFYGVVKPFLNNGSSTEPAYTYAPVYRSKFPKMNNWALGVDYNCDGLMDIFTDVPFGATVYRNDYSSQTGLQFTKMDPFLMTDTPDGEEILYVASPDIPAIVDVDGDGDKDILVFGILGSSVEYHKNMSMENSGNCDELEFELKNKCWGYFSENDNTNAITLYDTCPENVPDPEKDSRHAGSTVLALDLNGDEVQELVLGDLAYNNLVMLLNGGTQTGALMVEYDSAFPSNTQTVDLTVFPASFHLDVNNDGIRDLLAAPNNPVRSENVNNIWYFENQGTEEVPEFIFQQDNFLQESMLDLGEGARPVFFDFDGDGLQDIVAGNFGYFVETSVYDARLALYRNIGTQTKPEYSLITTDYSGLSSLQLPGIFPCFGDINDDGIDEMIVGDDEGRVHLFTDFSNENEPANFALSVPSYSGIDIGETAIPQIIDIDRDGLPDLLIGERSGKINYFRNTGIATNPVFSSTPTNDFFGGIDTQIECCDGYSAPYMTSDSLGNSMLYVGSQEGWLYLYNNIDGNLEGNFDLLDSLDLYGLRTTISGADINNDGKEEIIYGEYAGGMSIMTYGIPSFLSLMDSEVKREELLVYPNPATNELKIKLSDFGANQLLDYEIVNVHGKSVARGKMPSHNPVIGINNLDPGIYFIRISSEKIIAASKFVKAR